MEHKKDFKAYLDIRLANLPKEIQKDMIKDYIEVIKDQLKGLGVSLVMEETKIPIERISIPEHMKEFIDMLKSNMISSFDSQKSIAIDEASKDIGDSVVVTDKMAEFYMHDFETEEAITKNLSDNLIDFSSTPAIVIAINQEFHFNCGHCDETHKSNIVIYFPNIEKKYYIASNLVKLL
jgi:hypothetical protein